MVKETKDNSQIWGNGSVVARQLAVCSEFVPVVDSIYWDLIRNGYFANPTTPAFLAWNERALLLFGEMLRLLPRLGLPPTGIVTSSIVIPINNQQPPAGVWVNQALRRIKVAVRGALEHEGARVPLRLHLAL